MKKYLIILGVLVFPIVLKAQYNNTTNPNNHAYYSRYYDAGPRFTDKYPAGIFQYISEHVQYPQGVKQDISGQVNIHAIIDTNGVITDAMVVRSVSPEVDNEILNTAIHAPKWQPAMYKGKKVAVFLAIVMDVSVDAATHNITAKRDAAAQIKEMQAAKLPYDVKPVFPYENNNFVKYLTDNVAYPKGIKADVFDTITVRFNIDTTGKIVDASIAKNISKDVDDAVLEVFNHAPKFIPASMNGKKVKLYTAVMLSVAVNTTAQTIMMKGVNPPSVKKTNLDYNNYSPSNTNNKMGVLDSNSVYTAVEVNPSYPGGDEAFNNFMRSNIKYPEYSRKNRITGRVFIQFVVERDGELSSFKVLRTPSQDLALEAVRVMKNAGLWVPGMQNGKPVRVQFVVPINFSL